MEFLSMEFLSALLSIIMIDLLLAGDNAIVIGLAARKLPKEQQKKAIVWGTVGAIIIRVIATLTVVWLLRIPGLLLIGGVLLIWIAYKLLVDGKEHEMKESTTFWEALRTIIVADALMGLDNVLAVAGAAHGSFILVVIGLIISVPIMVMGSQLILKLIDRYPWLIIVGAGILAWTAAKMIADEPLVSDYFENSIINYGFQLLVIGLVVYFGTRKKGASSKAEGV